LNKVTTKEDIKGATKLVVNYLLGNISVVTLGCMDVWFKFIGNPCEIIIIFCSKIEKKGEETDIHLKSS